MQLPFLNEVNRLIKNRFLMNWGFPSFLSHPESGHFWALWPSVLELSFACNTISDEFTPILCIVSEISFSYWWVSSTEVYETVYVALQEITVVCNVHGSVKIVTGYLTGPCLTKQYTHMHSQGTHKSEWLVPSWVTNKKDHPLLRFVVKR